MVGSLPNLHTMDSRSACIQCVLKVKVKVKGHVIRALSWILGMSYSVIDGLVKICKYFKFVEQIFENYKIRTTNVGSVAVHGGWSSWSSWSECSLSCGTSSIQTRRRSCTSPQPRFGGRICVGQDIEISRCHLPPCLPHGSKSISLLTYFVTRPIKKTWWSPTGNVRGHLSAETST